jgi:hypothetical protein
MQLPREISNRLLQSWHDELAASGYMKSSGTRNGVEAPTDRVLTHEDRGWAKPARCLARPYTLRDRPDTIALAGQINEQAYGWQLTEQYKELVQASSPPFAHFSLPPDVGAWSDPEKNAGARCNGTEEWVSDEYRFIFRNMPKAGTNSLVHYFKCNFGMKRVPCQHIPTWKKRQYLHVSSHTSQK